MFLSNNDDLKSASIVHGKLIFLSVCQLLVCERVAEKFD